MTVALYGKKVGMTRVFDGNNAVAVTVVECLPNDIVEVKTVEKHGHSAVKVAVGDKRRKTTKPLAGEFKKADVAVRRFLREVPVPAGMKAEEVKLGAHLEVSLLDTKKMVSVTGQIKGRGFTGVMKRWNFKGHKMTHGTMGHRGPGSIGCRMDPGRVWKGKKMAGHYGDEQVTIKNLKIVSIDAESNLVVIMGAIPGPNGGLVSIQQV
jgi:large subunit ribosomal protein L3